MLKINIGKATKISVVVEDDSPYENQIGVLPASSFFTTATDPSFDSESSSDFAAQSEAKNSSKQSVKDLYIENPILNPEDYFENQWTYSGLTAAGGPQGFGKATQKNGDVFTGKFTDGKFYYGRLDITSGSWYVGSFKDYRTYNGTWNLITKTKDAYEIYQTNKGELCIGDSMTVIFPDRTKYTGNFKHGKKHGKGECNFPNGSRYVGDFEDDKFNGYGTYTFPSGSQYTGQFKNNQAHGHGKLTNIEGSVYEGEYKESKRHGKGILTHADGSKYDGDFEDDKLNGHGIYTFPSGSQ